MYRYCSAPPSMLVKISTTTPANTLRPIKIERKNNPCEHASILYSSIRKRKNLWRRAISVLFIFTLIHQDNVMLLFLEDTLFLLLFLLHTNRLQKRKVIGPCLLHVAKIGLHRRLQFRRRRRRATLGSIVRRRSRLLQLHGSLAQLPAHQVRRRSLDRVSGSHYPVVGVVLWILRIFVTE